MQSTSLLIVNSCVRIPLLLEYIYTYSLVLTLNLLETFVYSCILIVQSSFCDNETRSEKGALNTSSNIALMSSHLIMKLRPR